MLLSEIFCYPELWELAKTSPAIEETLMLLLDLSLNDDRTNVRRFGVLSFGQLITIAK